MGLSEDLDKLTGKGIGYSCPWCYSELLVNKVGQS